MPSPVKLNLLVIQAGEKTIKSKARRALYRFFSMGLINIIIQEHEC